ncbi:MAG: hypothetical protein Q7U02_14875 [Desulfosalsimonadaceae bacterium]|nr:hypothetical protein [Desulfosalsimonadaceae bacterium]
MKKFTAVLTVVLVIGASGIAMAGATANQTVTYQVSAINELAVSGSPDALIVNTATAGSAPDEVSNALTTYDITTNETRKLTGAINTAMPSGVTLKVALAATAGGTSAGDVTLTDTAADLVTGVAPIAAADNTITYKLSATPAAGVVASAVKTVTLTIAAP